jgi:hypothetical protein
MPAVRASTVLLLLLCGGLAAAGPGDTRLPWASEAPLSLYDPHPAPGDRPWFEGYYTRIVPEGWGGSVAVLAGTCSAPGGLARPHYAAVLVQRPGGSAPEVHEAFPARGRFDAQRGPARPDVRSPAGFRWTAPGVGWFSQDEVRFRLPDGTKLEAQFEQPVHWSRGGPDRGPEGYLVHLPFLTQHWFVHSVASRCRYRLELPGEPARSGIGVAHQEKNWGSDFPTTWAWGQAVRSRPGDPDFAQVAFAGGALDLRVEGTDALPRRGWLLGVQVGHVHRSFKVPLDRFEVSEEPERGRLRLIAEGPRDRAEVRFEAPPSSFVALRVPSAKGFRHGAVESFRAEVAVALWTRTTRRQAFREVARARLKGGALEFGHLPSSPQPEPRRDEGRKDSD